MPGIGPAPQPEGARARRNRSSTRTTLRVIRGAEAKARKVPPLPRAKKGEAWQPRVQAWWRDLWQRSDLTDQFLEHEKDALAAIAKLLNRFWLEGDLNAQREFRLMCIEYGLDPMARRRLQQQIDRGEAAAERSRQRRNERAKAVPDPRAALRDASG